MEKQPTHGEYANFQFKDQLQDRKKHFKKGKIKADKSGAVKIRVRDLKDFIADKHLGDDDKIIFHFAAYQKEDYGSYQKKYWLDAMPSEDDFVDRPTIVI